jgi:hypothetical protein
VTASDPDPAPELEELYDERTLAAIDGRTDRIEGEPWQPTARRRSLGSAVLTGMALALREIYDPPPDGDDVVEIRPDSGEPPDERWVTFLFVPGAPEASRLIVRPWLSPTGSLVS